jgi:hypothetical protein
MGEAKSRFRWPVSLFVDKGALIEIGCCRFRASPAVVRAAPGSPL